MIPVDGPTLPLIQPERSLPEPLEPEAKVGGFGEVLESMVMSANGSIREAEAAGEAFAAGQRDDIHGTMLALSKADIELRVVGTMRNKIVDAFYELWRMQV
ncbi:MAG: flagellar hook-basal body complex protein FliE [Polyangiaceae bacterium]